MLIKLKLESATTRRKYPTEMMRRAFLIWRSKSLNLGLRFNARSKAIPALVWADCFPITLFRVISRDSDRGVTPDRMEHIATYL